MARLAGDRASARRHTRLRVAAAALLAAAAVWLLILFVPHPGATSGDGARHEGGPPVRPVAGLDLTPRGPLWPAGIGGLAGDPLDLTSRPLGETFRRDLQTVSNRPGR